MNFRSPLLSLSIAWAFAVPAFSQTVGLETLVEKSQAAMAGSRWEEALDLNKRAVSRYGQENPLRTYGAQFGAVYYRKGVCEMKLKRWDDALRSFEICYKDFPNEGADRGNSYQKLALLKWGEAAMGAENWELAVSRFAKFTDERDREADKFPQGAFYINLAVCQYKLGHLAEGNENLEIAIRNKENFPTPDAGVAAGFQALVETAISKKDEQVLLDFIAKNRGELVIGEDEMKGFSGVFLKLAGEALAGGMRCAAISVYQFVPDNGDDATEIVKLAAFALIHEERGNVRGAFAAYQQLERYFPKAAGREDYLYHLVRTAVLLGEEEAARIYAGRLLKEFPKTTHLDEVRTADLDIPEAGIAAPPLKPVASEPAGVPLPKTPEFALAMDLYQGRKYQEAKSAFAAIRKQSDGNVSLLAKFYDTECLRKLGDLEGLAKALPTVDKKASLGACRLRQLEIDSLWEAVRAKSWDRVDQLAREWSEGKLPADQRAQIACCQGLALEKLNRPLEALDACNIAMTADGGTSEDVARDAALGVLRILNADPEVREAVERRDVPDADRKGPGYDRLKEAAAVAALFQLSLGAGTPLPEEFVKFLKYRDGV